MGRGTIKGRGAGPDGSIVRRAGKRGPQLVRIGGSHWCDEAETRFLDALAASCNVRHAASQSGFSQTTVYTRRRTDACFAARWQAALAQGYVRLETLLVQRATEALEGDIPDVDAPIPAMTVREMLRLLQMHRAGVAGEIGYRPGRRPRPRTLEEVRASIMAKLEAVAAMPDSEADGT